MFYVLLLSSTVVKHQFLKDTMYNTTQDVFAIILEFWLLFIHTLRGQYESFLGNFDAILMKQMHF